jgi:hypothetical protein
LPCYFRAHMHSGLVRTCLLVAVAAGEALAQSSAGTPGTGPRFAIAVYVGNATSGTARDLESAMRSAGYTQNFGGCGFLICVPTRPSPESYSHANPYLFSLRYAIGRYYGVEALFGGAAQGTTSGRSSSEILNVFYGGTVFAPMLSAGVPRFRVGVGPALLRANWDYHSADPPSDGATQRVRTTSLGWIAGATARLPFGKTFFVEGTAQHRGFSSPTVRPSRPGRPSGPASVSHSYVALGVGVAIERCARLEQGCP